MSSEHQRSVDAAMRRHPAGKGRREIRRHGIEHADPLTTAQHAHDELDRDYYVEPMFGTNPLFDRIVCAIAALAALGIVVYILIGIGGA